ncbi:MAG TPA: hypothetical protein VG944_08950 [Fimbriimonas sp.]|nr:hypothetical protein [Fimbriimonas sp.]
MAVQNLTKRGAPALDPHSKGTGRRFRILTLDPRFNCIVFGLFDVDDTTTTMVFEHVVILPSVLMGGDWIAGKQSGARSVPNEVANAIRLAAARGEVDAVGCLVQDRDNLQKLGAHAVESHWPAIMETAAECLVGVPITAVFEHDLDGADDVGIGIARKVFASAQE